MLRRLKGIYKKFKSGETKVKERYTALARIFKKDIRITKRDCKIRVTRNAKSDPKEFFQIFKTKNKDRIGPLKRDDEIIENNEDMSSALNKYSLSVFVQRT